MSKFLCYIISIIFYTSCFSQSKNTAQIRSSVPLLPFNALDRTKLDTTYEYEILKKPIFATLPDSVFGKKLKGSVEFWVMIDNNKLVKEIKIISYEFFKKRKLVYKYNNGEDDKTKRLQNTLLQLIQKEALKQNKEALGELHPTYCFITF